MKSSASIYLPALVILAINIHSESDAQEAPVPRPPAASLKHPSTLATKVDAAGFIHRWLLLEPIKVSGRLTESAVQESLQSESFPNQLSVMPHEGDTITVKDASLKWHAVDTIHYNVNLYHFAWALNKPTSNILVWAVTVVDAPKEMTGVRLAIGSNAASEWWLNDEHVISIYGDRQAVIDDGVSMRVTLHKGRNVIRAAIVNGGGATDFCTRFLDANDQPITGLSVLLPSQ